MTIGVDGTYRRERRHTSSLIICAQRTTQEQEALALKQLVYRDSVPGQTMREPSSIAPERGRQARVQVDRRVVCWRSPSRGCGCGLRWQGDRHGEWSGDGYQIWRCCVSGSVQHPAPYGDRLDVVSLSSYDGNRGAVIAETDINIEVGA